MGRFFFIPLLFLSFILSGCLAGNSLPPLTFQGDARALKPGDILETGTGEIISFEALLARLAGVQVVYVGESHTNLEDHRIQYQLLVGLYRTNKEITLAMEMFPRRVQPVLDRFSSGGLSEEDFLKEVNWSEVWGYPFQLYRSLMLFARENRLKVLGLNAPREVVNKIARGGVASLDPDDRKQIAGIFLTEDPKHREILAREFERHLKGGIKDFQSFYEAQLAWDETMAETLMDWLGTRPSGSQILVLIGKGHIMEGVGLPQAALKRRPHSFKTVVPIPVDYPLRTLGPDLADYLWITPAFKETHPPRLGLQLKVTPDARGLEVVEVISGGPADRAGFQKGDIIVQAAGKPVQNVEDLHRIISGGPEEIRFIVKRSGEEVALRVKWVRPE